MRSLFTLKILLMHFLFLALPLILNSFLFFHEFYLSSIQTAKAEIEEVATLRTYALSELEPESEIILNTMAYFLKDEQEGKASMMGEKLQEIGRLQPLLEYILFQRDDLGYRAIYASQQKNIGKYAKVLFPMEKLALKKTIAFFSYEELDGEKERYAPLLMMAKGLRFAPTGQPLTILVQQARIGEPLSQILSDREIPGVEFAVISSDGVAFAATNQEFIGNYFTSLSPFDPEEVPQEEALGKYRLASQPLKFFPSDHPNFFEFIYKGETNIGYVSYIPELDFSLLVFQSKKDLFNHALKSFFSIYVLFGVVIIIGSVLAFWVAIWIAKPLRQLSHLMGAVSKGNYEGYFKAEPWGFEINILGEVFNSTLDALLSNIKKENEQKLTNELLAQEIDLSREVQKNLLTIDPPKIEGIESSNFFIPGKDVSGGFFLLEKKYLKDGTEMLLIMIADPQGVGISRVLYALTLRSLIRGYATVRDSLQDLVQSVNRDLIENNKNGDLFIEAWIGLMDPKTLKMEYTSLGMPPPWSLKEGKIEKIKGEQNGVFGKRLADSLTTSTYTFERGESLFLLNRKIYALENNYGVLFTEDALVGTLKKCCANELKRGMRQIQDDLEKFTKNRIPDNEVFGLGIQL